MCRKQVAKDGRQQKADVQAYLPHRPSFSRRVSLELRKGTKTRPFFLAFPSALIHSANASKDLQHCTILLSFTNVSVIHAGGLLLCIDFCKSHMVSTG